MATDSPPILTLDIEHRANGYHLTMIMAGAPHSFRSGGHPTIEAIADHTRTLILAAFRDQEATP